jgi:hypothetical protein
MIMCPSIATSLHVCQDNVSESSDMSICVSG